ncbi:mechanosensitive ion channel family protein [Desulfatirhabdium butyrativorans]|uniref:mechanosensitive ion channel family protein n=1 Tax=Desulfatirhabdium butyrativorans TaxID=340467 RepID=UPI00041764BC|nr:mechanosensitive ion channel family protein [Desulfatirhabdium butyrativorans]
MTIAILLAASCLLTAYGIFSRQRPQFPRIPILFFLLYCLLRLVIEILQRFGLTDWPFQWLHILTSIALTWAFIRLALSLSIEIPLQVRGKKPLAAITRDFILFVAYTATLLMVLRFKSNINLISLVTTSAALTVVAGLAAQSILSNFFSGLLLQMEKPFDHGDWVRCGDHLGLVVGVNWKSTRLLTREQQTIFIPNAEIFSHSFINYSKPDRRVVASIRIGIDYTVPPNTARKTILRILGDHPAVYRHPEPEIWLTDFSEFSVQYEIRFWHNQFSTEPRLKSDILTQLWYTFRREGIPIPFPIRDVRFAHVERKLQASTDVEDQRKLLDRIEAVPILAPLSREERALLAKNIRREIYATGETVVQQNEPGNSLYIVHQGRCAVYVDAYGNDPIAFLGEGEFFGEMSLLTGEPRSATVKATEDTLVLRIDKLVFSRILAQNETISVMIAEKLAERQQSLQRQNASPEQKMDEATSWIDRIRNFFGLSR